MIVEELFSEEGGEEGTVENVVGRGGGHRAVHENNC